MRSSTALPALLVLAFLAIASSPPATAQQVYTVRKLGSLGGGYSWGYGLNEAGQVCGMATDPTPYTHFAFQWDGVTMTKLVALSAGMVSEAFDINASGQVIGMSGDAGGFPRATLWTGGVPADLGTLGGTDGRGYDLNDATVCTGQAHGASGGHAFRWTAGSMADLGTLPGGSFSAGYAINAAGTVAGWATDAGPIVGPWAVYWPLGGGPIMLDPAGVFLASYAQGINDAGDVVGWGSDALGHARPFLWTRGGGIVDLGTPPAYLDLFAYAINAAQDIVGTVGSFPGGVAMIHDSATGLWFDLNDRIPPFSDIGLQEARDINDSGQITGWGPLGTTGETRAYLLTPVESGLALGDPFPGLAPGPNSIGAVGATPGERVYIAYGTAPGSTVVPGCAGLAVAIAAAKVAGYTVADAAGKATLASLLPGGLSGRTLYVQAVEPSSCRKSNLVVYTFP